MSNRPSKFEFLRLYIVWGIICYFGLLMLMEANLDTGKKALLGALVLGAVITFNRLLREDSED